MIQTTEDAVRELDVMLEMAIDSEDLKKAMQDAGMKYHPVCYDIVKCCFICSRNG